MKRFATLLNWFFVINLWVVLILGCKSSSSETKETKSGLPPKAGVEYKHGTKIIVQYLPAKDETNIYQQEFKMQPELISVGKPVKEKHSFEINNMASYSGRKPSTIPTNLSFTFTHSTPNQNGWHYPPKAKFIFIADGERVETPVYSQTQ